MFIIFYYLIIEQIWILKLSFLILKFLFLILKFLFMVLKLMMLTVIWIMIHKLKLDRVIIVLIVEAERGQEEKFLFIGIILRCCLESLGPLRHRPPHPRPHPLLPLLPNPNPNPRVSVLLPPHLLLHLLLLLLLRPLVASPSQTHSKAHPFVYTQCQPIHVACVDEVWYGAGRVVKEFVIDRPSPLLVRIRGRGDWGEGSEAEDEGVCGRGKEVLDAAEREFEGAVDEGEVGAGEDGGGAGARVGVEVEDEGRRWERRRGLQEKERERRRKVEWSWW